MRLILTRDIPQPDHVDPLETLADDAQRDDRPTAPPAPADRRPLTYGATLHVITPTGSTWRTYYSDAATAQYHRAITAPRFPRSIVRVIHSAIHPARLSPDGRRKIGNMDAQPAIGWISDRMADYAWSHDGPTLPRIAGQARAILADIDITAPHYETALPLD